MSCRQENRLLLHLVFSLLPVQVLIVAMGSVNSLLDGVIVCHKRHAAVCRLHITDDAFVLDVCPAEPEIEILIDKMAVKMQETLDLCRKATEKGSPFRIRQEKVIIRKVSVSNI